MPNALSRETSPYLLQHAENPVDWLPWGEEAFRRARERDVPVLISIGYSACHWCHVMERESFEDQQIAEQMNADFVCVKVDREERPDVDAIYIDAVQAMTGSGGWPLNAFITPEGVPFWAGTYFPPRPQGEMPSWTQVLTGVASAWRNQRADIDAQAGAIVPRLAGAAVLNGREAADLPDDVLTAAAVTARKVYDTEQGGFGGAPKFPPASLVDFLLGRGEREISIHTLRAMANGGIYDQIGGGFSRYAVDARWIVPHFEKMLYDNALLARTYLHGWQATGDKLLRRVTEETLDWMLRDLRQDEGGFASALDADSEGVEGRFYVWTPAQVREALPAEQAERAIVAFGIADEGNWEGVSIPVRAARDPEDLAEIKAALRAVREQRVWPALDDKRVASWNALAISAFADAGAVLGRADYLDAARDCAQFVLGSMRDASGRLLRTFNRGEARLPAYLEDHAYLTEALLTLYEATFEESWFVEARALADATIERFGDDERGGFFSTAHDHERLVARRKEVEDSPIPAGQSAMAFALLRLSALTGEAGYREQALPMLRAIAEPVTKFPTSFGHVLKAMAFHLEPVREIAIVGDDPGPLLEVVRSRLRPGIVLAGGRDGGGAVPLLEGRGPVDGRTAAYVCEHFTCQAPVTDPDALAALLD